MKQTFSEWLISKVSHWLLKNEPPRRAYLCDFPQICEEVRPGDILLIEGRNRVSQIIQLITKSPWSHAALYIGKLSEIKDDTLRHQLKAFCPPASSPQLLIESEVGEGTIASPITKYQEDHIRILRPQSLSAEEADKLIKFAVSRLGRKYDLKHIFDLARFLFPWGIFPRRWRSSLFQHNALKPTEDICASMIADAFHSINYPILPQIQLDTKKNFELIQRNPRLFTPSDFDYSPYFNVIKYPIFKLGEGVSPEQLPWKKGAVSDQK